MWPSGDSECEGIVQKHYVPRQAALWKQWSKVVELMTQRDPVKVRENVDEIGRDGFQRFGKECREFCRLYQAMFHEQHCRSFYLHTLLHHAGDFMRELEKSGMCLGMMSNSGAERRHEYGRRAAKKAVAGGCWRAKVPALAEKQNWMAYLTLKEIMIWQHGTDLVSHELALRAASKAASAVGSLPVLSRRAKNATAAATSDGCPDSLAPQDLEPTVEPTVELPTEEETRRALDEVAEIADERDPTPAMVNVDFAGDESLEGRDGVKKGKDGKLKYFVDEDRELFRGRDELCGVLEQESVAGSDEFEDEDAEEMARRIKDLDALRGDWLPEEDDEGDVEFVPGPDDAGGCDWPGQAKSRAPRRPPPAAAPAAAPERTARPQAQPVTSAPAPLPGPPASGLSAPKYTRSELMKKTVKQLRDLCLVAGLVASGGKKNPYIESLLTLCSGPPGPPPPPPPPPP